jgi:hypothetical protein
MRVDGGLLGFGRLCSWWVLVVWVEEAWNGTRLGTFARWPLATPMEEVRPTKRSGEGILILNVGKAEKAGKKWFLS